MTSYRYEIQGCPQCIFGGRVWHCVLNHEEVDNG